MLIGLFGVFAPLAGFTGMFVGFSLSCFAFVGILVDFLMFLHTLFVFAAMFPS